MENNELDLNAKFTEALLKAREVQETVEDLYYSANEETRRDLHSIAIGLDMEDTFQAWTASSWCLGN